MATDARVLLWMVIATLVATPVAAQQSETDGSRLGTPDPPLFLIDGETRVESLGFRFTSGRTVDESRLASRIALDGLGTLERARRAFAWLPLVDPPSRMRFRPVELQRDKLRLLRFYAREGFPRARVDYEVALDTLDNAVDVTFVIDEGPPRILSQLEIGATDGGPIDVSRELDPAWSGFRAELDRERGARLSQSLEASLRSRTLEWWRDHGHAFAAVSSRVDSSQVDPLLGILHLGVDPGPRTRIGAITVDGNRRLSERTILRELPFESGDLFRSSELTEGQTELFGLDLVRLALVRVPEQPVGPTADVRVQIEEGSLRTVEGQVGYASDDGVSLEGSWSHRDFTGAARRLSVTGEARTGWWSGEEGPSERYALTTSLRQPYVTDRRVSALASPFVDYRDDRRDQSARAGMELTLLWERGPLRTMTLSYGLSARWVLQSRGGGLVDVSDLLGLVQALDTLDADRRTSAFSYTASWAEVDDVLSPRSGWVARLRAEVAGPAGLSDVQYGRISGGLEGFVPLGARSGVVLRTSAGRLFPFGASLPRGGADDALLSFVRLGDAVFTAGGTGDVRGWAAEALGPKIPDWPIVADGDSLRIGRASRYVPLGGFQRMTGSIELQVPMPFAGKGHSVHGFLDAGRVWTRDSRFLPSDQETLLTFDDDMFLGTGFGVQFGTRVGPLRVSLGYKLNPSAFDLRDPGAVGEALLAGLPLDDVPTDSGRRWQLHLSLGRSY